MAMKRIYYFGGGKAEGNRDMKELLGGKGAGLAEMSNIGIPVPPGFTITTGVCTEYNQGGKKLPKGLDKEIAAAMKKVEALTGKRFGDPRNPLLVSVRSGARVSMPGMMDTVLNLGLNDETAAGLAVRSGNERFAWDSYRRFCAMFGDVVLGMKPSARRTAIPSRSSSTEEEARFRREARLRPAGRGAEGARRRVQGRGEGQARHRVPRRPHATSSSPPSAAVFDSWENDRANAYRSMNGIPANWGTAVNVQSMVFGNMGEESGTGVAFTRNPATGENEFYGEFLVNAQGEDVVAGIRTPQKIVEMEERLPQIARQLDDARRKLERHYKDMQDIEFTIEQGQLYLLQTRTGKRTGIAAVRIAVEMADEKLIPREEAVARVEPDALNHLLRPIFDASAKKAAVASGKLLAKGLPAGPGAASGRIVFFASDAEEWHARGEQVMLARHETSPEDIRGMAAAEGFVTAFGGMTSHAALVARQMGKVAIVGCDALTFDYDAKTMTVAAEGGKKVVNEGDWISLDGIAGEILEGKLDTTPSEVVQVLIEKDRDPADAPLYQQYAKLLELGRQGAPAQGARQRRSARPGEGRHRLRRPGHRPVPHRAHVLRRGQDRPDARDDRRRERGRPPRRAGEAPAAAARATSPASSGRWTASGVTIRTIDPPLHEFLPHDEEGVAELAKATDSSVESIKARIAELHESNPMLGTPRLPPRDLLPGDHRDAGARHLRGRRRRGRGGHRRAARDDDPARRREEGARPPGRRSSAAWPPRCSQERGRKVKYLVGHDDRGPARRAHRRRDRREGRVLLLRDERPHPDHLRPVARRRGPGAGEVPRAATSTTSTPSSASTARAWAR